MKVSVSLPTGDVEFLDSFAREQGYASRSAAMHQAVRLLKSAELVAEYEAAFVEWDESEDSKLWDAGSADGID